MKKEFWLAAVLVAFLIGIMIGNRHSVHHFVPIGGIYALDTTTGRRCIIQPIASAMESSKEWGYDLPCKP